MVCPPTYHAPCSIVVLLQGFGGDHSPPFMALRHEGCQCQRRAVVLHSPRVLRESLPVLSKDYSGTAALSVVEKAAPGIRARNYVVKDSFFVVCTTSLSTARQYCGGATGGNEAIFGSPFFYMGRCL